MNGPDFVPKTSGTMYKHCNHLSNLPLRLTEESTVITFVGCQTKAGKPLSAVTHERTHFSFRGKQPPHVIMNDNENSCLPQDVESYVVLISTFKNAHSRVPQHYILLLHGSFLCTVYGVAG